MMGNCHVRFLGEGDGATQAPLPDKLKTEGRNILVYTIQALSKTGLKRGLIQPSMLAIEVQTKHKHIDQVRIVPRNLSVFASRSPKSPTPHKPVFLTVTRYRFARVAMRP